MDKDSIKELESLIWDYKYYRSLTQSLGGNDIFHSQYAHFQAVIQMCDNKIQELQDQIDKSKLL